MLTAAFLFALTGCGKMAVDGVVVDVTGAPIAGATVTLVGSQCQSVTDESGVFRVPCLPGEYLIHINADGFIEVKVENFDASERKSYDIGKQMMVTLPTEEGLLLLNENSYTSLPKSLLVRTKGGAGLEQWKHYCLPEDREIPPEQIIRLPEGNHAFFDNEAPGWRPWILDEDGCAYKMEPKTKSAWETTYGEKANFLKEQIEDGKSIVLMELPAGRYFVADWEGGFFTRGTIGEEKGFIGHYIVVE